jgi:hypothetical protein
VSYHISQPEPFALLLFGSVLEEFLGDFGVDRRGRLGMRRKVCHGLLGLLGGVDGEALFELDACSFGALYDVGDAVFMKVFGIACLCARERLPKEHRCMTTKAFCNGLWGRTAKHPISGAQKGLKMLLVPEHPGWYGCVCGMLSKLFCQRFIGPIIKEPVGCCLYETDLKEEWEKVFLW